MRFMVLLKSDENEVETGRAPTEAEMTEMAKFNEELVGAGVLLSGEGLAPSREGAKVKLSKDGATVTDGPFTEAKELIAGFWILDVPSLEDAISWVKRIPGPEQEVEIRRVLEAEDFGEAFTPELQEKEAKMRAAVAEQRGD
ncbi:YciI family protein [Amycolatopsis albispora]|uniref:Dehydrogenase n=1 Tax=Amycolatopsis albispora TaxID=1804986 RepID=A0A344LBG4_9PSEU|nr:YciI family protein [Amycolatopsis albispora]AXB45388.1 dehydrogenase [Amycolatopsis albispora]